MWGMLKRHEVEVLLKAGHRKTEVARMSGVSLRSVKRIAEEEAVVHVWMTRPNETNDRSAGPAQYRISGNRCSGFSRRVPTCRRWRSCAGCERRDIRGARRRFTIWWLHFAQNRLSHWCVSKGFRESSASTISER